MNAAYPDELHSPRLLLRKPREADAAPIFAAYTQDPTVSHYMVWRPHRQQTETAGFIADCLRAWQAGSARPYVLALNEAPDRPIGMLDARRAGESTIDLGYVLARAHWGRGLMPEAITALAAVFFSQPRGFRMQATCDVDNIASARTLEKSGFVREGRLERWIVHPNIDPDPRPCFLYARCR